MINQLYCIVIPIIYPVFFSKLFYLYEFLHCFYNRDNYVIEFVYYCITLPWAIHSNNLHQLRLGDYYLCIGLGRVIVRVDIAFHWIFIFIFCFLLFWGLMGPKNTKKNYQFFSTPLGTFLSL